MAGIDYANLRTTATRLLTNNGKTITLTRETDGAYDPSTGGSTVVTTNPAGVGVLVRYRNNEVDGTTILSSDRRLIYTGDEPKIDDRYGVERIVDVFPIDPDESGVIVYTCQLRK